MLDFTKCSLCGSCVEACRDGAIRFSHEYNLASTNKEDYVMDLFKRLEDERLGRARRSRSTAGIRACSPPSRCARAAAPATRAADSAAAAAAASAPPKACFTRLTFNALTDVQFPASQMIVGGVFLLCAATTVAGALIAALTARIIRSVCGLAICCIGLAGLYYFLHSPFLALMEILIYVGAVCVTIVFAVMLAEPDEPVREEKRGDDDALGRRGAS